MTKLRGAFLRLGLLGEVSSSVFPYCERGSPVGLKNRASASRVLERQQGQGFPYSSLGDVDTASRDPV